MQTDQPVTKLPILLPRPCGIAPVHILKRNPPTPFDNQKSFVGYPEEDVRIWSEKYSEVTKKTKKWIEERVNGKLQGLVTNILTIQLGKLEIEEYYGIFQPKFLGEMASGTKKMKRNEKFVDTKWIRHSFSKNHIWPFIFGNEYEYTTDFPAFGWALTSKRKFWVKSFQFTYWCELKHAEIKVHICRTMEKKTHYH
jgi:hypothetical protein